MARSTVIVLFLYSVSVVRSYDDQCIHHKVLSRDSERSKDNAVQPTDINSIPCDDVADGWYRFATGEIATSCVPTHHCGTSSTIWMKDPVPKIGESRLNEFCVNHQAGSNPSQCCLFPLRVNVTNCNGFLVYYFRGSDVLCPSGYCKGDLKACQFGESSSTGFEPCTAGAYPKTNALPTLHPPVLINNGHDFSHTCDINYNGSNANAAFDVTWMFDGIPYKTVTLKNGVTSASLTSADWKGHLGEKLSCSVETYFDGNPSSPRSPRLPSKEYLGGMKVTPVPKVNQTSQMTLNIHEGDTATLSVQSTLPVVCPSIPPDRCQLNVDVSVTGGNPDVIFFDGGCSAILRSDDWDPVKNVVESRMKVSSLIEPLHKTEQHFNITYTVRQDTSSPEYFQPQSPFEVAVVVTDGNHQFCMVTGAADIIGFKFVRDFRIGVYTGDFLLYNGTRTSGIPIEVQIRNWKPVGQTSSVCGVAFRYGDTLIKVDMCSNLPNMTAPVITQGEYNPEDVAVYLCSANYEIVTADGVQLSIAVSSDHLDVKLHLSPSQNDQHLGLCSYPGTYTSLLSRDRDHYHVPDDKSLFGAAAVPFYKVTNKERASVHYCQCGGTNRDCSPFRAVGDPASPIAVNKTGPPVVRSGCTEVVPHALKPGVTPLDFISSSGGRPLSAVLQYQSYQTCEDEIRKHSSSFCLTRFIDKIRVFKEICGKDARYSGNIKDNMASAIQGFHWYCQEYSLSSNGFYLSVQGELIPPTDVTSDLCSSVCGLQGTCVHGICACDPNYKGVDCSVMKNAIPVIVGVIGGNLCEYSSLSCETPILITKNVYPSNNLLVILNATDVASANPRHEIIQLEPVFENKYSVSLPMSRTIESLNLQDKSAIQFSMKITTDGKVFSQPYNYLIYDDKCQECGLTDRCVLKGYSCHINGRCYAEDERNPTNSSQICNPNKALKHWTEVPAHGHSAPVNGGVGSVPIVG